MVERADGGGVVAPGEILEKFKGGYLDIAEAIELLDKAFAAPAQASTWQPIEMAPKDGTRILLFKAGRGAFEGWWHTAWPHPEAYWMDDADSEPDPTHWRPALALPSTDRGGK